MPLTIHIQLTFFDFLNLPIRMYVCISSDTIASHWYSTTSGPFSSLKCLKINFSENKSIIFECIASTVRLLRSFISLLCVPAQTLSCLQIVQTNDFLSNNISVRSQRPDAVDAFRFVDSNETTTRNSMNKKKESNGIRTSRQHGTR